MISSISKKLSYFSVILILGGCVGEDSPSNSNTPPAAFRLLLVNDGATEVSSTPTLSWEASSDSDGDPVKYELYLESQASLTLKGKTEPEDLLVGNLTAATFTLTQPLAINTSYKWRVVASDGKGGSTKSTGVFTFTTLAKANTPPVAFTLNFPADQAKNVSLKPNLSWNASADPDGGAVTYDIFLDKAPNPTTLAFNSNTTTGTPTMELEKGTTYYWRAEAIDAFGARSVSTAVWSFETLDNQFTVQKLFNSALTNSEGIFGGQMVYFNENAVILAGGNEKLIAGASGESNRVYELDFDLGLLLIHDQNEPKSFVASDEHQMVEYQNKLYVFDGNRNTIHVSSTGSEWESVDYKGKVEDGTHYSPRSGHQVVEFKGKLFLIGGFSGGFYKSDVWSSADGGVNWVEEKPSDETSFSPRYGHEVVVFEDKLFLIGGSERGGPYGGRLNDVWSSEDGKTWKLENPEAEFSRRREHTVDQVGSILFLVGGDSSSDSFTGASRETWISYDGINWVEIEMPEDFEGREQHSSVVIEDRLVVFGGLNGTRYLGDLYVIN